MKEFSAISKQPIGCKQHNSYYHRQNLPANHSMKGRHTLSLSGPEACSGECAGPGGKPGPSLPIFFIYFPNLKQISIKSRNMQRGMCWTWGQARGLGCKWQPSTPPDILWVWKSRQFPPPPPRVPHFASPNTLHFAMLSTCRPPCKQLVLSHYGNHYHHSHCHCHRNLRPSCNRIVHLLHSSRRIQCIL